MSVPLTLLGLLEREPSHGYDLKRDYDAYFGRGYQDIVSRKPSIDKARRLLGWSPATTLAEALRRTFDAFLDEWRSVAAESIVPVLAPVG